jgi:sulfite exporter TauE/SafE/copper chaperone CopZ
MSHSHSTGKRYLHIRIGGMTCRSCELLLEERLMEVPGVLDATINWRTGEAKLTADARKIPDEALITTTITGAGYSIMDGSIPTISTIGARGRKWLEIGAMLVLIFAGYTVLSALNLVSFAPSTTEAASLGGVFLIGLVAGTSSCLAVTGGLLLAMAATYNETHGSETAWERAKPLLHFNTGRIAGYFVFGGLTGLLGQAITLTPRMAGYMSIAIAIVMLYMALVILEIIPKGSCPIRPPKRLQKSIARLTRSRHPLAPMVLGALTFFLPCGFTQTLQFAALASHSFLNGALIMTSFALGTLPSLIGLSAISSTARGSWSRLFLRFSGTLVFLLALWNIQSGLTLSGVDLTVFGNSVMADAPPVHNGVQEVNMTIGPGYYKPNRLTVRAGIPVRWLVNGDAAEGCTSVLVIPSLNISQPMHRGMNVVQFTPPRPGQLGFSCSMGMVRGSFTVI